MTKPLRGLQPEKMYEVLYIEDESSDKLVHEVHLAVPALHVMKKEAMKYGIALLPTDLYR